MHRMPNFVIEGVDRLGKGTLIQTLQDLRGFAHVFHYQKPKILQAYSPDEPGYDERYQRHSFLAGFSLLWTTPCPIIFDRFHLGEYVYAPRYRGYSGEYVFELEKFSCVSEMTRTRLVLLTTSNWDLTQDDGQSFDFNRRQEEQESFIEAFNRSIMPNKVIIDVHDGAGSFKTPAQIAEEALG